jgi:DNA-binding transcriptional ArsR family regulator
LNDTLAVQALGALAQASRLRVFRRLVVAGLDGDTPTRMAEALDLTPAALSFHLKELTHAGLVSQEREGRHLIYRTRIDTMNDLLGFLTANCCQGQSCLDSTPLHCVTKPREIT